MANITKKPKERKDSVTLSLTNKVHVKIRALAEERGYDSWSHYVEDVLKEEIRKQVSNDTNI